MAEKRERSNIKFARGVTSLALLLKDVNGSYLAQVEEYLSYADDEEAKKAMKVLYDMISYGIKTIGVTSVQIASFFAHGNEAMKAGETSEEAYAKAQSNLKELKQVRSLSLIHIFNWSRYIEIARAQDLGSAEVARLIRTETRRKVNISEVKRRLSVSGPSAAQIRQPDSLDVINLSCEDEVAEKSTLSISAEDMTFEFKTQRPEESVIFILSRMRGEVI